MTRKKELKSLKEKASGLARAARVVIHELAAKENSAAAKEAAELLDHALSEAVASCEVSAPRKAARPNAKSKRRE